MIHPILIAAFLIATWLAPAGAQTRELTLAVDQPPKQGSAQAAQVMINRVAELTQGKVNITLHHSAQLGNERQVAQAMRMGTVDMSVLSAAPLTTVIPELSALTLPYLFRDYQHVYKAMDEGDVIRNYYAPQFERRGYIMLGLIAGGYRGIYGKFTVNSLPDARGKKIRTMEDKIILATFKALGMIPTPIPQPEVPTSFQTGVIDFAEGGINTYFHLKYYDVAKNVADVRHIHLILPFTMSKMSWDKLDAASRQAIMEGVKAGEKFNRQFILDEDVTIQNQIKEKGVTITKPDPTPFREATKGVYDEFFATPAGKDAKKVVDYIIGVK
jgi:tripartite ATP-independent transporter DctP family solute receptor